MPKACWWAKPGWVAILQINGREIPEDPQLRKAVEVLKKTEQDVLPKLEKPEEKQELEEMVRLVRVAMGSGDRKKMEEASAALNDRLLNYAYLL